MRVRLMYLLLVLLVLGSGCEGTADANHGDYNFSWNQSVRPIQPGSCGLLLVKAPFYNVTFLLPAQGEISYARMHILPNQTPEAAVHAVHECASLGPVNLSSAQNASVSLPVGHYVLAYGSPERADLRMFFGEPQVRYLFQSNDSAVRWVAFSITE